MAYVSFSNYNGTAKNGEQPSIYKNYGQYGGPTSTPTPPMQPSNEQQSVKPPQGIRPSNTMVPRREDSFQQQQEIYQNDAPPVQNMQESRQVMQQQYDQEMQNDAKELNDTPSRVFEIENDKMVELLTKHHYHVTPDQKPMRIVCKVYTDWCKPCRDISPFFDRLSTDPQFSEILFVQLNADNIEENLAKLIKVSAVPVFIGFIAGKQVDFIPGPDREKLVTMCRKLANVA